MYEYKIIEGVNYPLFYFKTVNDYEYYVSFIVEKTLIEDVEAVDVSIDCISEGVNRNVKDLQIGLTVVDIIKTYLSNNSDVLLTYVCDDTNNQHLSRSRKFNGWYKLYSDNKYSLMHFENFAYDTNTTYYSSVIYNTNKYSSKFISDNFYLHLRSVQVK